MGLTRYLAWVLLPIAIWSLGGAWIEGFTKSQFSSEISLDQTTSTSGDTAATTHSGKSPQLLTPVQLPPHFEDNPKWQWRNSLNNTHYMLYHGEQPSSQTYEPFYYGLLTTMARIEGKLRRKKPITVTFLGGSVTAAYCKEPGIGCWVTPVSDWLLEQDPQAEIGNSAIGGITSNTASQCFDAMVSPTSDLVLVEFSLNDRFIDQTQQIQGFEQLLRRLLLLPHQPAIVVVHWWSPVHDCSVSQQVTEGAAVSPCMQTLYNTTEDKIQTLIEHYNVHSVSFRNAHWRAINAEEEGFTPDALFMRDEIHPSGRGVKLLGNLVIKFLDSATKKALSFGFQAEPTENVHVPQPMYVNADDDAKASQCSRGGALQDMVLSNYGWNWTDGKKPGFQTDEILTSLMLSIPVDSQTADRISVGYLSSYENMGIARVTCLGACQCDEFDIDATSTSHASQEHIALVPFQHARDSQGCILKLDNMNLTTAVNHGHRFKVSSVVVADREAAVAQAAQ